jgi:cellulose synthase/poly-beta-1,6-N-acetylglucosamine synthase-like glycosyltransferase
VLFMDDDMTPPPDAIVRLLAHDKPIVAAGCTVRQDPPIPNFLIFFPEICNYKAAKNWGNFDGLMQIDAVGTGFMLIKREALDTIGEYYLSCQYEREYLAMPEGAADRLSELRRATAAEDFNQWWFEFTKQPLGQGEFGEDISFCFKAMKCGIPVYVDTSVRPGHIGPYAFSLNDYCGPVVENTEDITEPIGEAITNDLAALLDQELTCQ